MPATVLVRRSDDSLKYDSKAEDGRTAVGVIPSKVGTKLYLSIFLLDIGITDAITDKHRKYTPSFVIPVKKGTLRDKVGNAPPTRARKWKKLFDKVVMLPGIGIVALRGNRSDGLLKLIE